MYYRFKRILDVVGASCSLILAAPLMVTIGAAVLVSMGAPILFRQRRPGLNERMFTCLKFRTMTDARDRDGRLLREECRVTSLGRLLRRMSLDELPQLWNILRGDLSFIGPRPLLEEYLPYYTPWERRRHSVRPGLTGWAQIHGRNSVLLDERLARDVWYVDHASLALDFRILVSTIRLVITQQGINPDSQTSLRLDVLRSRPVDCSRTTTEHLQ
jgi:sugar transferase EpsL